MYGGRRRSGGGSGTGGEGSKTSRGKAGASSFSSSTTLPAATATPHTDKGNRANGGGAAFSIRLQAKDILAELERSAGKPGGLSTSGRGREADYQVRVEGRRATTCETVWLSLNKGWCISDGGTFFPRQMTSYVCLLGWSFPLPQARSLILFARTVPVGGWLHKAPPLMPCGNARRTSAFLRDAGLRTIPCLYLSPLAPSCMCTSVGHALGDPLSPLVAPPPQPPPFDASRLSPPSFPVLSTQTDTYKYRLPLSPRIPANPSFQFS